MTFSEVTVSLAMIVYFARDIYIKYLYTGTTSIGGARDNFIKATCIKSICTKDIYFSTSYTKARICLRDVWIRNICAMGIRDISTKDIYFVIDAYIKSVIISNICGLAHKLCKSYVRYSRLLANLTSKMPVSSCLYLRVILDKVLYCYYTY